MDISDITFDEITKDLPGDQLHSLFTKVGWADGNETREMINNFNIPFVNSTLVLSAWFNDRMVGVTRILSDTLIRSIIYDLIVDPEFQNLGIGKELLSKCRKKYPHSEWLVQTTAINVMFYKKMGFSEHNGIFLSIPSKWAK